MAEGFVPTRPIDGWLLQALATQERKAMARLSAPPGTSRTATGRDPKGSGTARAGAAMIGLGAAAQFALQRADERWASVDLALGDYTPEDMAVFRRGFGTAQAKFFGTTFGDQVRRARTKHILIPRSAMPEVAKVDLKGAAIHGRDFTWLPTGARARRQAAIRGRGPAGPIPAQPGPFTIAGMTLGSWEEYPFACLAEGGAGAHVDKVPLWENWRQGGFIRAAAMIQGFTPNTPVGVYVVS